MDYLNRLRSTVTSVAAQVSSALPGNPLLREYELLSLIATAGPGLSWRIYSGRKYSTKQSVAVWVFEKKDLERWPRHEREIFCEILKKGVSQLTRLRHPRILVIEHPLEESRESLAFCTEPVFGSLANCLGRFDNLPKPVPPHLVGFELLDVEIRHGLFQLAEALSFLHIDGRMLHRNICPESVVVNERGAWKLAGFDFAIQGTPGSNNQLSFEMLEWDQRTMSIVQPSLNYLAPEYVVGGRCDSYADMFSLGVLAIAVFNECKPPFDHHNTIENFRKNSEQLKTLPASVLAKVPVEFRDDVKMCLNFTPDLRPDATQLSKIIYFDDPLTKALNYFDSLCQMDSGQKMQFFKTLPQVLAKFPKRPLLQKILPYLSAEFSTPDLIPFILPSIFLIAEQASNNEFSTVILPYLIPVFQMERPYQIILMLLQKMELLLQKTPEEDVRKHVLPLVYNALSNETTKIQELCLSIIPTVGGLVDRDSMKTQLLPKLLRLTADGSVLAVRVQALICIGKLLPNLEPWMVSEQILPSLPKTNSKEPGVLMAILGIYKLAYENPRFGIAREQCAKSVLPFLIATSVENTLNLTQFEQFVVIIRQMLDKVEREQRQRLQQLSASQEEQRSIPDFSEVIGKGEAKNAPVPKSLDDLSDLAGDSRRTSGGGSTPVSVRSLGGPLSLEDKKRLAAEQEQNLRMRSQPSILQPLDGVRSPPPVSSVSEVRPSKASPSVSAAFPDAFASISSASVLFPSTSASSSALPNTTTAIDLSEFLPTTSTSKSSVHDNFFSSSRMTAPSSAMSFPTTSAFSASSNLQQQFGAAPLNFASGPTPMGLPLPPPSLNPVQRSTPATSAFQSNVRSGQTTTGGPPRRGDMSAFDSLVSFPKPPQTSPLPLSSVPSGKLEFASKPKQPLNGKDLFGDLLR